MKRRVIESWFLLLYFDCLMRFRGMDSIQTRVRRESIVFKAEKNDISSLCRAIDFACVFYFKRVLCLQQSAAATVLLRRHGWTAEMVVGAQVFPFQSHAWVEVDGRVVNDRPYMREIFQELTRC